MISVILDSASDTRALVFWFMITIIVLAVPAVLWLKGVFKCFRAKQWLIGLFAILVPIMGIVLCFFEVEHIAKMMPSIPTKANDPKCCGACEDKLEPRGRGNYEQLTCRFCKRYKVVGVTCPCGMEEEKCHLCGKSYIKEMGHHDCPYKAKEERVK